MDDSEKTKGEPTGQNAEGEKETSSTASGGCVSNPSSNIDAPASPKDKRQRRTSGQEDDKQSPVDPPFMVPASPPNFMSIEAIMKAAHGVSNMALAHEIAVDNDFKLEKVEHPQNSLVKQVHDVMHQAFWDVLEEKLAEDPPDFKHALVLLQEVRESLLNLLLPHHQTIRSQISEVLDMDLITQKAEHGALDVSYYGEYVTSILAKLCAPVRDEQVAKLQDIKDIVPLFKSIFELMDLMKMDLGNFTIQQMRPFIQEQSVEYERKKFSDLLQQQTEYGLDGLLHTKGWLEQSGQVVVQRMQGGASKAANVPVAQSGEHKNSEGNQTTAQSSTQMPKSPSTQKQLSPGAIMNTAYVGLLDWPEEISYPETVLVDRHRFRELQHKTQHLIRVASVLLVTYNTVGASIAGIAELKNKLKDNTCLLLEDAEASKLQEVMTNVSEQVNKDVLQCLVKHGFPALPEDRQRLLKGQVEGVVDPSHAVYKIMRTRLMDSMYKVISQGKLASVQLPPGFSVMSDELGQVFSQFYRLVMHNRSVFGLYYAEIISSLLEKMQPDDAEPVDGATAGPC